MNFFVTGSNGFVGRALVDMLIGEGHRVFCLVRKIINDRQTVSNDGVTFIMGDLRDARPAYASIANEIDIVCHLAACIESWRIADFYEVNCVATKRLAETFRGSKRLKKFIYLSSTAAVGDYLAYDYVQSRKCSPFSAYGKSKLGAEAILQNSFQDCASVNVVIVRAPVIYGPGQPQMLTSFFKKVSSGKIMIVGSGLNKRSMCNIRNVVTAIAEVSTKCDSFRLGNYTMLEIADKAEFNLRQVLFKIADAYKVTNFKIYSLPVFLGAILRVIYKTLAALGINHMNLFLVITSLTNIECDIAKYVQLTGREPAVGFDDGIQETVRWVSDK